MTENQITQIPTHHLHPHPDNREIVCQGEQWDEFRRSIKKDGINDNLIVRPMLGDNVYQIISGERRWRAASQENLETVPCIVRDLNDTEARVLMMVSNIHRQDVDPVEEARGIKLLIEQSGLSESEVMNGISKSDEWVRLRQGLLSLPDDAIVKVRSGEVELAVVQMVLHLPSDRQEEALQMVLHPAFQEAPLNARQAHQFLEDEIIAPARARKEWEDRQAELMSHWTAELRKLSDPELDAMIIQIAEYHEATPKKSQYACDLIYETDLTYEAPAKCRWLHLAQRHGLPIRIHPARLDHDNLKLTNSIALVNYDVLIEGEKALDQLNNPEQGSAWLASARRATQAETFDPDAREDQAELDNEEARNAPKVETGGSLHALIDVTKIKHAGRVLTFLQDPDCEVTVPDWFPGSWVEYSEAKQATLIEALEWVLELAGEKNA